jgi:hypothetical protein
MSASPACLVASTAAGAYSGFMVALRLLRFLTLLALLVAPLRMMSAHAEMALPASPAAGHHMATAAPSDGCGGMDETGKRKPGSNIDCAMACSAVPGAQSELSAYPQPVAAIPPATFADALVGLHPESEPPPPRIA